LSAHEPELRADIGQLEVLIRVIEANADEKTLTAARELVQTLLQMHGAGFARLLKKLDAAGEAGRALTRAVSEDNLLSSLLLLHGLHPMPLAERVAEAVALVRPQLALLGGTCELTELQNGVVRLELSCPAAGPAAAAMQRLIEDAVYERAPDVARIEFTGLPDRPPTRVVSPPGLVTLRLPSERGPR
jgi:Fe-S cluster biogenesis protein NfuA